MNNNLKSLRQAAGLTQEQLAARIGTSKGNISKWETGERRLSSARGDTLKRIAFALGCKVDDLLAPVEFEYNPDGRLILDGLYHDRRFPMHLVAVIDSRYFLLPANSPWGKAPDPSCFSPIQTPPAVSAAEFSDWEYAMLKCVPRRGYSFDIMRAITADEMASLRQEYGLKDDDISSPFTDTSGEIYGPSYVKTFSVIQIRVPNGGAVPLEHKLRSQGIEANNIAVGRVNIRVASDERS